MAPVQHLHRTNQHRAARRKAKPTVTRTDVAEALVHLARLAAANAGSGVAFLAVDANDGTLSEQTNGNDAQSAVALATAVKCLLADRERLRVRVSGTFVARIHEALKPLFPEARAHRNDIDEVDDELVLARLHTLGFKPSDKEGRQLRVDSAVVRKDGGREQAVDAAIGRALGSKTGSGIRYARVRAHRRPPVPGALSRLVSLSVARQHVVNVFAEQERRLNDESSLPLVALRSKEYTEALVARLERLFKGEVRAELRNGRRELHDMFLSLMRGEDPFHNFKLTPEQHRNWGERWEELREKFHVLGENLKEWPLLEGADRAGILDAFAMAIADIFIAIYARAAGLEER